MMQWIVTRNLPVTNVLTLYDEFKRSMKIRAHYSKFLAQNEAVGVALRLNFGALSQRVATNCLHNIEPRTLFIYEGSLAEVILANKTNVLVRADNTLDQFYIGLNKVVALIQSYLG
jgi:hypothetical protein